ncbi:PREDICTED: uncharacterized protein LOC108615235 [Drosophila arizonae]|uniref:Uncharacterized protein LOC108615235 n=1 Tax=Drosophila arizonae TaxID=7263 RepID=A0ABM1PCY0_DROAR|nr:PREDICTED: uncharacterized protein LOC108615235 [Drosophila arizonae]
MGSPQCDLAGKVRFFCIWTMVTAVVFGLLCGLILSIYTSKVFVSLMSIFYAKELRHVFVATLVLLVLNCVHLLAGVVMFVGFAQDISWLFLAGLVLSSICPYFEFFLLIPTAIQIAYTFYSCLYYKQMRRENK